MGQTTDQIENHIERKHDDLRSNLKELEEKVKSATDWRQQFHNYPAPVLLVAFGGGLLLSRVFGRSKDHRRDRRVAARQAPSNSRSGRGKGEVWQAWDKIQSALIGVAAAKLTNTLAEVVPGFRDQLAARDNDTGKYSEVTVKEYIG